jgi:hypothetical protein
MNITLKRTDEQIELVKAMASNNRDVAYEAQAMLAEFIGPVLAEVINNAPTVSNFFKPLQFNADDNPSLPLDLYYDITDEDYITIYSQTMPGGLPTNQVAPTATELKVTTYTLDSALSFDRRYAAKSRLDVLGKTFTRMAQEVLLKQEKTSANLILGTLSDSNNRANHVMQSKQAGRFLLADLNSMITRQKRLHPAWSGGTPDRQNSGLTDLLVSPEVIEEIRGMAYNPINTRGAVSQPGGSDAGAWGVTATDEIRNSFFNSSGDLPSFFGVSLMELWQLGDGGTFTAIFQKLMGNAAAGRKDLVVGVNQGRESMLRVVAVDSESGSEFQLLADDQYSVRQKKIGYYGSLEEGRVILDKRVLLAMEV